LPLETVKLIKQVRLLGLVNMALKKDPTSFFSTLVDTVHLLLWSHEPKSQSISHAYSCYYLLGWDYLKNVMSQSTINSFFKFRKTGSIYICFDLLGMLSALNCAEILSVPVSLTKDSRSIRIPLTLEYGFCLLL
jgi:hypothetical protein